MPRHGRFLLNCASSYLAVAAAWGVLGAARAQSTGQEYPQRPAVPPQGTVQYQPSNKVYFPDKWHSSIYARDKGVVKDLTQPPDAGQRGGYPREPPRDEYQGNPPPPPSQLPPFHGGNYDYRQEALPRPVDGYRGDPQPQPPPPPFQGHRAGNLGYGTEILADPVDVYRGDPQPSPQATNYRTRVADGGVQRGDCSHQVRSPAPTRTRDNGPPSPAPYTDTPRKYVPAETNFRQECVDHPPACQQHSSAPLGPVATSPFHQQDYFPTEQVGGGHLGASVKDFYRGSSLPLVTGNFPTTSFDDGDYFGPPLLGNGVYQDPLVPDAFPVQYTSASFDQAGLLSSTYNDFGSAGHFGAYQAAQLAGSSSSEVSRYMSPEEEPEVEVLKTEVMALPASEIVFDIPPSNESRAASLAELPGKDEPERDPMVASASNVWELLAAARSNRTTTPATTTSTEPETTSAPTVFVTPPPASASRRSDTAERRTVLLMKLHGQPRGKVVVVVPEHAPPPVVPRGCPCEVSGGRRQRGAEATLQDNVAVEGGVSYATADFADFRDER